MCNDEMIRELTDVELSEATGGYSVCVDYLSGREIGCGYTRDDMKTDFMVTFFGAGGLR